MIFQLISIFIFLNYAMLIIAITVGWFRLKVFKTSGLQNETKISVIVALRNEEPNIESLLNSLFQQDYSPSFFEIILVDDHSTDSTVKLIEERFANLSTGISFKIIRLDEKSGEGKKTAINAGIKASNGELIVITDADCTAGKSWITTLAAFYGKHKPQMILGPVILSAGGSLFGKLQSLEFTSLISSAAGSCNAGFPLLANGANIAFTRQAYENCGGFHENIQYPSGDDMFLMMCIKRKSGAKSIRFLRSEAAIVSTPALKRFKPLIHQRLRWVSKSRGYTDPLLITASLLVFCVNFVLMTTGFYTILYPEYLKLLLVLFLSKMIIDFPLMFSFSRFQRSADLMWLFPVLQLLNAVYTIIIGIAGNFGRYEWKGRRISGNAHK
jgi:cellulose synthase/poly-beta-1,6-N-acetylglucosamine synthase-like glycosyltransferase